MFVWYVPSKRSSALQYLIYYFNFNYFNHICYRLSPVIEEYVRSPEIFRVDDDWFNSPELRGIPRHLIVFPSLDNQRLGQDGLCNWEPQIWSMLSPCSFLKANFSPDWTTCRWSEAGSSHPDKKKISNFCIIVSNFNLHYAWKTHQIHNLLEVQPKSNIDWFRLIEDRSEKYFQCYNSQRCVSIFHGV